MQPGRAVSADLDGSRIATDRRRAPAASHDACAAGDIERVSRRRTHTTSRNERQPRRERTRESDIALLFFRRESQLLETRPSGRRTLAIPSSVVRRGVDLRQASASHRRDGAEFSKNFDSTADWQSVQSNADRRGGRGMRFCRLSRRYSRSRRVPTIALGNVEPGLA